MRTGARLAPVAGVAAALLTIAITRHGALVGGDTVAYLKTARVFADDPLRLFDAPLGTDLSIRDQFPPGYSIVLALGGASLAWARWVGVALAGLTVAMVVGLVRRDAGPRVAAAVGVLLVVSRGYLLVPFGFAMSDGLFLALAVAATVAVAPVLRPGDPARLRRSVITASAAAALAFGTRYAGLGVVAGIAATVALLADAPRRTRLRWAAASVAIGALPTIAWKLADSFDGNGEIRHLGLHALAGEQWDLIDTWALAFAPRQLVDALGIAGSRAIGLLCLVAILAWSADVIRVGLRPLAVPSARLAAALLFVGWGYHLTLWGARLVADRNVTVGGRYAMALLTFLVAAAGLDAHRRFTDAGRPRRVAVAGVAVVAVLVVGAAPGLIRAVTHPLDGWSNYSHAPRSGLVASLRDLPRRLTVYSNKEDTVWLQSGRPTARLPRAVDHFTGEPDPTYDRQIAAMLREVHRNRAVVVVFAEESPAFPLDRLRRLPGVTVVMDDDEGIVLS